MAFLNPSPVACLPKTMWLCAQVFTQTGEWPSTVRIAPDSLNTPAEKAHVKVASSGLEKLGFGTLNEAQLKATVKSYGSFLTWLRSAVSNPSAHEAEDVRAGVEWLMKQDPITSISSGNYELLNSSEVFVNPTRWNTFRFWAIDLGFAESSALLGKLDDGLAPNPVRAIIDTIRTWSRPTDPQPVRTFIDSLSADLPLLPSTGSEVDLLGKATSWALLGAHFRGWLTLTEQADAARMFLSCPEETGGVRAVTHVVFEERGDE